MTLMQCNLVWLVVFERYNIVSAGDLRDAARRLELAGTIPGTLTRKRPPQWRPNQQKS